MPDNNETGSLMAEIPEVCLRDGSLGASRLLLVAMYRLTPRGSDKPKVWARTSSLAIMLGADQRTVQRHLITLEDRGYIRTIDGGWLLAYTSDGAEAEEFGDNIVASRRQDCRPKRQDCRHEATTLSPPTTEEPRSEPRVNQGVEQSPPAPVQAPLFEGPVEAPPVEAEDPVASVWAYQHELRVWAYAKHGRTGRKAPRGCKLDRAARKAVSKVLSEYTVDEVREVLRTAARDASESERSLSFFDGVSNWRPDNFRRFASADPDLLSARHRSTLRDERVGPLLAPCAHTDDERCQDMSESQMERGRELMSELVG